MPLLFSEQSNLLFFQAMLFIKNAVFLAEALRYLYIPSHLSLPSRVFRERCSSTGLRSGMPEIVKYLFNSSKVGASVFWRRPTLAPTLMVLSKWLL